MLTVPGAIEKVESCLNVILHSGYCVELAIKETEYMPLTKKGNMKLIRLEIFNNVF